MRTLLALIASISPPTATMPEVNAPVDAPLAVANAEAQTESSSPLAPLARSFRNTPWTYRVSAESQTAPAEGRGTNRPPVGEWSTIRSDRSEVAFEPPGTARLALGDLFLTAAPGTLTAQHADDPMTAFVRTDDALGAADWIRTELPPVWSLPLAAALGEGASSLDALPVVGRVPLPIEWEPGTETQTQDVWTTTFAGRCGAGTVSLEVSGRWAQRADENTAPPEWFAFALEFPPTATTVRRLVFLHERIVQDTTAWPDPADAVDLVPSLADLRPAASLVRPGAIFPPEMPLVNAAGRAWTPESASADADEPPLKTDAVVLIFDRLERSDQSDPEPHAELDAEPEAELESVDRARFRDALALVSRARRYASLEAEALGLPTDPRSGIGTGRVAIGAAVALDPADPRTLDRLTIASEGWDEVRASASVTLPLAWSGGASDSIDRFARRRGAVIVVVRRTGLVTGVYPVEGTTPEALAQSIADAIAPWRTPAE